jgi:hypothetical protein
VRLKGPSGVQKLKVVKVEGKNVTVNWPRPVGDVRARVTMSYSYQAHLKSLKNNAFVKSQLRYIVIRAR